MRACFEYLIPQVVWAYNIHAALRTDRRSVSQGDNLIYIIGIAYSATYVILFKSNIRCQRSTSLLIASNRSSNFYMLAIPPPLLIITNPPLCPLPQGVSWSVPAGTPPDTSDIQS